MAPGQAGELRSTELYGGVDANGGHDSIDEEDEEERKRRRRFNPSITTTGTTLRGTCGDMDNLFLFPPQLFFSIGWDTEG